MQVQYKKWWSKHLQRQMEYKTYGHAGHLMLAVPSQDGRFWDWEDRDMIATLAPWIDSGKLRVVCCDSIDWETWSNQGGDDYWRIRQHENWINYIVEELLGTERYGYETVIVGGCSLGAFHAANLFFRFPDIFDTLIAQSGLYNSRYGFPYYQDELTYANSPEDFLGGMPEDHHYMHLYRQRKIIVSIGKGRWEDETMPSTQNLDKILKMKGVPAWFDYWGENVDHDWVWWRPQLSYFMRNVIPLD